MLWCWLYCSNDENVEINIELLHAHETMIHNFTGTFAFRDPVLQQNALAQWPRTRRTVSLELRDPHGHTNIVYLIYRPDRLRRVQSAACY